MTTSLAEAPSGREPIGVEQLPQRHLESLRRTQDIASSVGSELQVHTIEPSDNIPSKPGVYVYGGQIDADKYHHVMGAKFDLEPKILSGKIDSAHAVLPGALSFVYIDEGKVTERQLSVAAKGYYKRELSDRLQRVATEVRISQLHEVWGEIAYTPIAVVVAPSEYQGNSSNSADHDILLITELDESSATLDNSPWHRGFDEANLELAEAAINALGRFNSSIGKHGDAKIKNVAQHPSGLTSMIDFETSAERDLSDSANVATVIHEDLTQMFSSLEDQGFFRNEPYRSREVLERLAQDYIGHWERFPALIQDTVFNTVTGVVDSAVDRIIPQPHKYAA